MLVGILHRRLVESNPAGLDTVDEVAVVVEGSHLDLDDLLRRRRSLVLTW